MAPPPQSGAPSRAQIIEVPYHLDERLVDFDSGLKIGCRVNAELSASTALGRMAEIYQQVAVLVSQSERCAVVSGDCTTALATLAGLQRRGSKLGVVWLDAHGDFNTMVTTESGYIGGMPLAMALGLGDQTISTRLGLKALSPQDVLLVDARQLDTREADLIRSSGVTRLALEAIDHAMLPLAPLYLHVDVDVVDGRHLPALRYPSFPGPSVERVCAAVRRVIDTGRVAAVGYACTWFMSQRSEAAATRRVANIIASAIGLPTRDA